MTQLNTYATGGNVDWFGAMPVSDLVKFSEATGLQPENDDDTPRDMEILVPILHELDAQRVLADVRAGLSALAPYPAKGRTARARWERATADASAAGLTLKALAEVS